MENSFNQLDIIISVVVFFGLINGFFKGFISQLVGLFGFVISIAISFKFYYIFEKYFKENNLLAEGLASVLALLITFGLAYISIRLISKILNGIVNKAGLGLLNRIAGAILGFVVLILLNSTVLYYIDPILEIGFKEIKDKSALYPYLNDVSDVIKSFIFNQKNKSI